MPLYEYECAACGNRFEQIRKFSDPPVEVCPRCGERNVQKLFSSPAIQFKGSGWYITDYARKGGDAKESSESKEPKAAKEASDSKDSKDSKDAKESKPASTSTPAASASAASTKDT